MSNLDWIEHINDYLQKFQVYLEVYNEMLIIFHEDISISGTEVRGVSYKDNFDDPEVRGKIYRSINRYLKKHE